jgi:4-alpha-glucanotransferase
MQRPLVEPTFVDAFGAEQRISPEILRGVEAAMGGAQGDEAADDDAVVIVRPGGILPDAGEVVLEDGTELGMLDRLPPDVPYGYHRLLGPAGRRLLLLCGPGRCPLPAGLRAWGWAIQLATTRSATSWGIGDLGDLRELSDWSARAGAGFLAVGPLGAPNPGPEPEPSPYYPSTRRWINPLHLRVEEVPGAERIGPEVSRLAATGRALNDRAEVDRRAVLRLKLEALERIWASGVDRSRMEAWRRAEGAGVDRWATFVVLTERHGPGWQGWPEELRRPDGPAVTRAAERDADRVAFHAWIQWCLDRQLAAASEAVRRFADMPVGVDPGGFDAWDWQDALALGAAIGAPPDRFNSAGQSWGLPPFVPHRLRSAEYGPFIETLRAQLRHAGGLRIDHVLGLFRLWCIPAGEPPDRGAYVRMPTEELLEIVAIEADRAGAIVVGEDLGTVPPGVRRELRRRRLLSTRLALFERVPPARYPRDAFAGVTTHDLPTIAGLWSGADLRDQAAAGIEPDEEGLTTLRRRLARAAGVSLDSSIGDVTVALHGRLADAPSVLVAATLEDALGVERRPNLPGTVSSQRPNWSLPLPIATEQLATHPGVRRVVEAFGGRRRTSGG